MTVRKILVTSRQNTQNHWLEHTAQSRHFIFQQEVESQQKSPLFEGSTSRLKYEELIEDWLDLAVLEETKRGPALKNRLIGDAEMYKGLFKRESLRATDGVKYFRNTLRPHFTKGAQNVFLWRFYQFNRARRGSLEMVKWICRVFTVFAALQRCLDGPLADVRTE